jgi:hypothetical protein
MHTYRCATDFGAEPPRADEYADAVEAFDAEDAAEQAAETADRDSATYPDTRIVWVASVGTGEAQRYSVFVERIPSYSAVLSP